MECAKSKKCEVVNDHETNKIMTLKFMKFPLYYKIVMYKAKKATTEKLQNFTNSLIQLKIPEAIFGQSYLIQWLTQPNQQMATKCIFSRYDTRKPSKEAYFQCTPLDLGCNIKGRIIRKDKQKHEIIYENDFGQVAVQNQILAKLWIRPPFEVKIVFNKTMVIKGSINLKSTENKNNLQKKVLAINLPSSQFQFQIKIDENIRLPSNNSFFKFYKGEPQSLGLSIYHQHAEFMDKVKRITNVQATDFYLKLVFESRAERDIFLFKIMENFGIITNSDALKVGQYERFENKRSIQSIPQRKSNSKIKQLDDQILKLLCDASDVKNQLSLDLKQAENLLSSCKQIQLLNKSILDQSFENVEVQKQQQKESNKAIKNRQQQIDNNNDRSYQKSKQNSITANLKSDEDIQYKREINKLTNEIRVLIEENKRLNKQNKRLKEENMKLRLKDIKNSSVTRKSDKSLSKNNKDRNHSKSPAGYHKRKASILAPQNTQGKNSQICQKQSFRQTIWKGNIKDYAKKSCRRQHKGQLAASTGSVLFGGVKITSQEIKQKNNKQYMSTASTKDLGIQDKSFIVHGSNVLTLCKSEERLKNLLPHSSVSNCMVAESCELLENNFKPINKKFTSSSSSLSKLRNTNSPLTSSVSIRLQKIK